MNRKKKNSSVLTSFLATCAGITAACICVLLIAGEYHSASSKVKLHNSEVQGWEACRQANPDYYKASENAVTSSKEELALARSNFWVKIPKVQLAGILALGGLCSAAVGYIATWSVFRLARLGLQKVVAWLNLRLQGCPG